MGSWRRAKIPDAFVRRSIAYDSTLAAGISFSSFGNRKGVMRLPAARAFSICHMFYFFVIIDRTWILAEVATG